jgi:septal ring factor EnvC (AmiA/AmiB activator)
MKNANATTTETLNKDTETLNKDTETLNKDTETLNKDTETATATATATKTPKKYYVFKDSKLATVLSALEMCKEEGEITLQNGKKEECKPVYLFASYKEMQALKRERIAECVKDEQKLIKLVKAWTKAGYTLESLEKELEKGKRALKTLKGKVKVQSQNNMGTKMLLSLFKRYEKVK